jgi:hypothetical protein
VISKKKIKLLKYFKSKQDESDDQIGNYPIYNVPSFSTLLSAITELWVYNKICNVSDIKIVKFKKDLLFKKL